MATVLRRPFAISSALKALPKSNPTRSFHQFSPLKRTSIATKSSPSSLLSKVRNVRSYNQQTIPINSTGSLRQRLLYGAGIFGGTVLAINLVFNRETREDGGMPPYERSYLNETFLHTGLGVGIIGVAARALHMNGWSLRLMAANPWLVMGGGLVVSIGSMYGCLATSPDK